MEAELDAFEARLSARDRRIRERVPVPTLKPVPLKDHLAAIYEAAASDPDNPAEEFFTWLDGVDIPSLRDPLETRHHCLRLLFHYAGRAAGKLRETKDELWLRRGLDAMLAEDFRVDYRDTHVALDSLWVAAVKAGMDPAPAFEAAALAASDRMAGLLRRERRLK